MKGTVAAGVRRLPSSPSLNQGIYHKKQAKQVNRSGDRAKPVRQPHLSKSRHSSCQGALGADLSCCLYKVSALKGLVPGRHPPSLRQRPPRGLLRLKWLSQEGPGSQRVRHWCSSEASHLQALVRMRQRLEDVRSVKGSWRVLCEH